MATLAKSILPLNGIHNIGFTTQNGQLVPTAASVNDSQFAGNLVVPVGPSGGAPVFAVNPQNLQNYIQTIRQTTILNYMNNLPPWVQAILKR